MGATVNEQFSHNPKQREIGLVTGTVSATQFPDKPVKMLRLKANEGNSGLFVLGDNGNNQFFELGAGDDTGWIPANNMNEYWYSDVSGTLDHLNYWRLY